MTGQIKYGAELSASLLLELLELLLAHIRAQLNELVSITYIFPQGLTDSVLP